MSKQLNGDETGLLAYWKLNNSYANAVAGGNSLTVVGFPFFSVDTPFCDATATLKDVIMCGIIPFAR